MCCGCRCRKNGGQLGLHLFSQVPIALCWEGSFPHLAPLEVPLEVQAARPCPSLPHKKKTHRSTHNACSQLMDAGHACSGMAPTATPNPRDTLRMGPLPACSVSFPLHVLLATSSLRCLLALASRMTLDDDEVWLAPPLQTVICICSCPLLVVLWPMLWRSLANV